MLQVAKMFDRLGCFWRGMRLPACVQEIERGATFRLYIEFLLGCLFSAVSRNSLGLGLAMAKHVCFGNFEFEMYMLSTLGPEGVLFNVSYALCVLVPG